MNWFEIIAMLLLGAILYALLNPLFKWSIGRFKERAPLIKKYWLFITPLIIITLIAYTIVGLFFYSEVNFSLVGQISGFLLAVFVGYIAFSELGENRFDKLKESARLSLAKFETRSAKNSYEEAHTIKPKDTFVLGNLLEMYVIHEYYDKFDSKIKQFNKIVVEDGDKIASSYLLSMRYLFEQRIGDAEEHIKNSVNLVSESPNIRKRFYWTNKELLASDGYKKLQPTAKKIIKNHFDYLTHSLSEEDEIKFRNGNYELN